MKGIVFAVVGLFLFCSAEICFGDFQRNEEVERMLELPDDFIAHLSEDVLIEMKVATTTYRIEVIDHVAEIIVRSDFELSLRETEDINAFQALAQACSLFENKIRLIVKIRILVKKTPEKGGGEDLAKKPPSSIY